MTQQTAEMPRPLTPRAMSRLGPEARKELHRLTTPRPVLSAGAFVLQYVAIAAVAYAIERSGFYWIYPIAVVFIAARQHSLYLLTHDASHSSLFKSRATNKVFATWFANLPFFHHPETWSFVQWRRAHIPHHSDLCTERDYYWQFRRDEKLITREITRPELFWRLLKFSIMCPLGWVVSKQRILKAQNSELEGFIPHWRAFFTPFLHDKEMRNERLLTWGFTIVAVVGITLIGGWRVVLLYWIVPMYTVYPIVLELSEMTEHHWHGDNRDIAATTTSTIPGIFTKLFYSEMNRTLHREHHLVAKVPYYNLLPLHNLLVANGVLDEAVRGYGRRIQAKPWSASHVHAHESHT